MSIALLFTITLFLAYANGANDNFKPVATLYGSSTVSYKTALTIATAAQIAGSVCAIFLAQGLIASFSGKGLVPQETATALQFLLAVGFGAALTVMLATRLGFPISTTHSLVGGLIGAGLMAVGLDVSFSRLSGAFVIPLLVSPFLAFALGACAYWLFRTTRQRFGLTKESCVCIGESKTYIPVSSLNLQSNRMHSQSIGDIAVSVADLEQCVDRYTDTYFGFALQKFVDIAHGISAAAVAFARGLNDTPKIAGLLVAAAAFDINWGLVAIGMGMALGGILNARRVAETISHKITEISHGQGFSANLVTAFLVIVASKFGVPVSTTHVSVGSIFGISLINKKGNMGVIKGIILSWLVTLPIAAALSAITYLIVGVF